MSNNVGSHRSPYSVFSGPNLGYVMEMYELFKTSPDSVDPQLAEMFRTYGAPVLEGGEVATSSSSIPSGDFSKALAAYGLIESIRAHGHLAADIYPLKDHPRDSSRLELSKYGLTEADLLALPASLFLKSVPAGVQNGLDAVNYLKGLYTGNIAYEFSHLVDEEERTWIQSKIENNEVAVNLSNEGKKRTS